MLKEVLLTLNPLSAHNCPMAVLFTLRVFKRPGPSPFNLPMPCVRKNLKNGTRFTVSCLKHGVVFHEDNAFGFVPNSSLLHAANGAWENHVLEYRYQEQALGSTIPQSMTVPECKAKLYTDPSPYYQGGKAYQLTCEKHGFVKQFQGFETASEKALQGAINAAWDDHVEQYSKPKPFPDPSLLPIEYYEQVFDPMESSSWKPYANDYEAYCANKPASVIPDSNDLPSKKPAFNPLKYFSGKGPPQMPAEEGSVYQVQDVPGAFYVMQDHKWKLLPLPSGGNLPGPNGMTSEPEKKAQPVSVPKLTWKRKLG